MKNRQFKADERSRRLLSMAHRAWEHWHGLRTTRERCKRFTYGDQWSDMIRDEDASFSTAYDNAVRNGRRPMTNNLIRSMVKSVIGRFRLATEQEPSTRSERLQQIYDNNQLDELDSRMLEEFLISGCAIQRVVDEIRPVGQGPWVDNVNPRMFFVNEMNDPRGFDIELIGMMHQMSLGEALIRFGGDSLQSIGALRSLLSNNNLGEWQPSLFSAGEPDFLTNSNGRCNIAEIWTLESRAVWRCHDKSTGQYYEFDNSFIKRIEEENNYRAANGIPPIDTRLTHTVKWHCRWITPNGVVLDEYDSPYAHGSHPFIVKFYPLIDSEVHSLVSDVLEQQVNINRLMTTMDYIMGTAAKGALLIPANQIPAGTDMSMMARNWASPDGVIVYNGDKSLAEPKQLTSMGNTAGASELLHMQLQMFGDVSGVNKALQGNISTTAGGARLYESQVENSNIAIKDLILTFMHFRRQRDQKVLNL